MRWFLLVVLVFGSFGFSQRLSDDYTTDEAIEFFNSEEFLETNFFQVASRMRAYYGPMHISGFIKMITSLMEPSDPLVKKIQKEVVFGTPLKLYNPITLDDSLLKNIETSVSNWKPPTNPPSNHRMFGEIYGARIAYIDDSENTDQTVSYSLAHDLSFHLLPIYHRQKFEGYLKVNLYNDEFFYIKEHQSFSNKTPMKIGAIEAQQLASLTEEPLLYDFNSHSIEGWFDLRRRWFWIGETKAISATTGEVFELRDFENEVIAFSEIEPVVTIAYNGTIEASLPIIFRRIQKGPYSENFNYVRLNNKLGWDLILLCFTLPLGIIFVAAYRQKRKLVKNSV